MQQPALTRPRRQVLRALRWSALGGALLLAGGCASGANGAQPREAEPKSQAEVTVRPADGTRSVPPNEPVSVAVAGGSIQKVTLRAKPSSVRGKGGKPPSDEVLAVEGGRANGAGSWTSVEPLLPGASYTVRATAVDPDGLTKTVTTTFTTVDPAGVLRAAIAPLNGETVGVGMPIHIDFSHAVADRFRDDVERRLEITMSQPVQGAWHWLDGETLHFRPREYWPAGEHVTLTTHLVGVPAGGGVWGDRSRTIEFDVGERHVSVVHVNSHTMKVKRGGRVVRTFPISAGSPKNPSSSGTHVALAKEGHIVMDSASYGVPVDSPQGYSTPTDWNVRLTWSGQFVHSAPWSLGAQGQRNVSHGCVNLSPGDAKWFYNFTQRGDIVKVVGSSRKVQWRNGWTDWNMPWDEWVAGSALNRSINGSA